MTLQNFLFYEVSACYRNITVDLSESSFVEVILKLKLGNTCQNQRKQ